MEPLSLAYESGSARLYRIGPAEPGALESYVATTPGTRAICNDPTVAGVRYTRLLREACTEILRALAPDVHESDAVVVNILRGGLNFGLRLVFNPATHDHAGGPKFRRKAPPQ